MVTLRRTYVTNTTAFNQTQVHRFVLDFACYIKLIADTINRTKFDEL